VGPDSVDLSACPTAQASPRAETYRETIKAKLDLKYGSERTRHAIHGAMRQGE
jgi:hypothetical protein